MRPRARVSLALCAWRVCALWLAAACTIEAKPQTRPLFASDTPLEVTLQAPWSEIQDKPPESVRHAAVLAYADAQGQRRRIEATVESRGITRLRLCRFPPLRLRFGRSAVAGTEFEGQRSLKLVTHCNAGPRWEQYYLQEMLAYRIYNLVTDHSFRIRPLAITYQGLSGGHSDSPQFAFLIEDVDEMARRNGRKESTQATFAPSEFDPLELSRFMLFQYLIGNTDWEVRSGPEKDKCCHNVRVTEAEGADAVIAVPYDLDSSGLVDAEYAGPHKSLPIKLVTERLFRGYCRHNEALEIARQEFLAHRQAIFDLLQRTSRLSLDRQRTVTRYIRNFYLTLESDARFARHISGKCRK